MTIATQDFEQMMNQARVKLAGASERELRAELFDVLWEFFDISSSWKEDIEFDAVSTTHDYDLVPSEGQITKLVGVMDMANGTVWAAMMEHYGRIHLRDLPNTTIALTATVAKNVVLPTGRDGMPIAPRWVLPVWHGYILDGMLGKMMTQPNKPYTVKDQGLYHLKRFREGCERARVAALRRNTFGMQAWRFPNQRGQSSQRGGISVGANTGFGF